MGLLDDNITRCSSNSISILLMSRMNRECLAADLRMKRFLNIEHLDWLKDR